MSSSHTHNRRRRPVPTHAAPRTLGLAVAAWLQRAPTSARNKAQELRIELLAGERPEDVKNGVMRLQTRIRVESLQAPSEPHALFSLLRGYCSLSWRFVTMGHNCAWWLCYALGSLSGSGSGCRLSNVSRIAYDAIEQPPRVSWQCVCVRTCALFC